MQKVRTVAQDLHYALRGLRNAPSYAFTVILTLALGLGATTAMLAVVDCVLLRPVDLPHPEQLVTWETLHRGARSSQYVDYNDRKQMEAGATAFSSLATYETMPEPVGTVDGTKVQGAMHVSGKFFRTIGVAAARGRVLNSGDAHQPVAVVTEAFWRSELHSMPNVIGTTLHDQGNAVTVVGVLPAGLHLPDIGDAPIVVFPESLNAKGEDSRGFAAGLVVGRLRPGATIAAANAQLNAIYSKLGTHGKDGDTLQLVRLGQNETQAERPGLWALLSACALLLLIACVNAANLQLARGSVRAAEMQVRAALGASRGRLLQQIATESVTVSLLGAGCGLFVAWGVVHAARSAYGRQFARFDTLALHPAVFAGCAVIAVVTGLLAALAPGFAVVRNARSMLAAQAHRSTRRSRTGSVLVAAQIALTCVLLVTAGLFIRTFRALEQLPLGYDPHHVTDFSLMPVDPTQSTALFKQQFNDILAGLRALPGVEAATTQTSIPGSQFQFTFNMTGFLLSGRPKNDSDIAWLSLTDRGYNQTMRSPVLAGRGFQSTDTEGAEIAGLVNKAFEHAYLGGRSAVGHVVQFPVKPGDKPEDNPFKEPVRIVGVVPNEVSKRDGGAVPPMLYFNYRQISPDNPYAHFFFALAPQFAVRSALPQAALDREIRSVLKRTAPNLAEMGIQTMDAGMGVALTTQRLALRLSVGFGVAAMLLAAIGIYGVLAFTVAQRTREIGIRMALGSSRRGAVALVLHHAGWMCGAGLLVGLGASWPAGRAVRSFLFGVQPLDPATTIAAAAVLLLLCAGAAAIPAARAATVDPMMALREE